MYLLTGERMRRPASGAVFVCLCANTIVVTPDAVYVCSDLNDRSIIECSIVSE